MLTFGAELIFILEVFQPVFNVLGFSSPFAKRPSRLLLWICHYGDLTELCQQLLEQGMSWPKGIGRGLSSLPKRMHGSWRKEPS